MKIYAAAVEALRKKEREDETQFTAKINGFSQFHPLLNANVGFFCRCFHPVYDKTQGSLVLCFFLTLQRNSIVYSGGFEHGFRQWSWRISS